MTPQTIVKLTKWSMALALFLAFTAWQQFAFTQDRKEAAMSTANHVIESQNKTLVLASFEAWKAGTGSPYDLLADDAQWTIVGHSLASKTYKSREAFMSEVIRPFNARMSVGLKPTIRHIYTDGNTVIVFFDASGTARDGKTYANTMRGFSSWTTGKSLKHQPFSTALFSMTSGSA